MSWEMPKRIPKAGAVHDYRDMNRGHLPMLERVDGHKLNEHNMSSALATELTYTDLAQSVAWRASFQESVADVMTGQVYGYSDPPVLSMLMVPGWTTLKTKTYYGKGGPTRFRGGVQYYVGLGGGAVSSHHVYLRVGIRVDGTVFPELVNGDQDSTDARSNMEVGYSGYFGYASVEGLVPMPPGQHTVDFVGQLVTADADEAFDDDFDIYSNKLFILEMGR